MEWPYTQLDMKETNKLYETGIQVAISQNVDQKILALHIERVKSIHSSTSQQGQTKLVDLEEKNLYMDYIRQISIVKNKLQDELSKQTELT